MNPPTPFCAGIVGEGVGISKQPLQHALSALQPTSPWSATDHFESLVQLGGLEPPTSCSTDRAGLPTPADRASQEPQKLNKFKDNADMSSLGCASIWVIVVATR